MFVLLMLSCVSFLLIQIALANRPGCLCAALLSHLCQVLIETRGVWFALRRGDGIT